MHASDRVSPTVDMLEEHSEHGTDKKKAGDSCLKSRSGAKFNTSDKGVIQKIREVLDAVEKDHGNFIKSQAVLTINQVTEALVS